MNHPHRALLGGALLLSALSVPVWAQTTPPAAPPVVMTTFPGETKAQHDARMQWWRDARFGMFIHWGVYAVPAGNYHGKPLNGAAEWLMNFRKIPIAEYRGFSKDFTADKYDPEAWVKLAKEAGMKYIVITAKHHEGFALYDSKVTDWDVMDSTPAKRDLLRPLVDACHKYGLKIGFYYSQAQDWVHPGGSGNTYDPAHAGDMDEYLKNIAVPQVKELLTNYGKIDMIWWDTAYGMNPERAKPLAELLKTQPEIISNNRLGGGYKGDIETPEQWVPVSGFPGRDWETCMTMNGTWGYNTNDTNWKSSTTLVRTLIDSASKGGNYLLNVGPTAEGLIPEASVERLQTMGRWMKENSESIYGTSATPLGKMPWGRITRKTDGDKTTLYLHVFDWPQNGDLFVPGLYTAPKAARVLTTKAALQAAVGDEGITIKVPEKAVDEVSSTLVLEFNAPLKIDIPGIKANGAGVYTLASEDAGVVGSQLRFNNNALRSWTKSEDTANWSIEVPRGGVYEVKAEINAKESANFEVTAGEQAARGTSPALGDSKEFQTVTVGTLRLAPGRQMLLVRPVAESWKAMNLRGLTLTPVG